MSGAEVPLRSRLPFGGVAVVNFWFSARAAAMRVPLLTPRGRERRAGRPRPAPPPAAAARPPPAHACFLSRVRRRWWESGREKKARSCPAGASAWPFGEGPAAAAAAAAALERALTGGGSLSARVRALLRGSRKQATVECLGGRTDTGKRRIERQRPLFTGEWGSPGILPTTCLV